MTRMSLNTAIMSFAFSGMLAPHGYDEPFASTSHASDEAAAIERSVAREQALQMSRREDADPARGWAGLAGR